MSDGGAAIPSLFVSLYASKIRPSCAAVVRLFGCYAPDGSVAGEEWKRLARVCAKSGRIPWFEGRGPVSCLAGLVVRMIVCDK